MAGDKVVIGKQLLALLKPLTRDPIPWQVGLISWQCPQHPRLENGEDMLNSTVTLPKLAMDKFC